MSVHVYRAAVRRAKRGNGWDVKIESLPVRLTVSKLSSVQLQATLKLAEYLGVEHAALHVVFDMPGAVRPRRKAMVSGSELVQGAASVAILAAVTALAGWVWALLLAGAVGVALATLAELRGRT